MRLEGERGDGNEEGEHKSTGTKLDSGQARATAALFVAETTVATADSKSAVQHRITMKSGTSESHEVC